MVSYICVISFISDNIVSISNNNKPLDLYEVLPHCEYCSKTFEFRHLFEEHICDFSSPKTIVFDDVKMSVIWENSPMRRIYTENNARLEQFINHYNNLKMNSKDVKTSIIHDAYKQDDFNRNYVYEPGFEKILSPQEIDYHSNTKENANVEVIKCLICSQIFNSPLLCFTHLMKIHPKCGFNDSAIELKIENSLLFSNVNVDHAFQCEFCDLLFTDMSDLFAHKMEHDICSGFECNFCQLTSRNLGFILNHRNSKCPKKFHEERLNFKCKIQFACNNCCETFDSLTLLYEHR